MLTAAPLSGERCGSRRAAKEKKQSSDGLKCSAVIKRVHWMCVAVKGAFRVSVAGDTSRAA